MSAVTTQQNTYASKERKLKRKQKQALLALEEAVRQLRAAGLTDGVISWLESPVPYKYLPVNLTQAIETELLRKNGHASLTLQLFDMTQPHVHEYDFDLSSFKTGDKVACRECGLIESTDYSEKGK